MIFEYIWIDGFNELRSKTRVLHFEKMISERLTIEMIPNWNYDGSSTNQASCEESEILLKPCALYKSPFVNIRSHYDHFLVLCETFQTDLIPHITNTRHEAAKLFEQYKEHEPMFGIEQEFFLMQNGFVASFQHNIEPAPQDHYYCGVGTQMIDRDCVESAFVYALKAGLKITGMNAEVAPSQWEIQVCATGIDAADQLIMLRYILQRTAEQYNYNISIHPKPLGEGGTWNGSGCHVNFSTKEMRENNGYEKIKQLVSNLSNSHKDYMKHYGNDNHLRMTGKNETSSFEKFSYGVGDRSASVRIPNDTHKNKKGYIEDRRPSSNMDPYVVTSLIFKASLNTN